MTAFPTVAAGRNSSAAAGPATIAPVRRREGGCPHDPLFGNKLPDTVGPRGPQWTRAPEDRGANGAGVDREARRLLERPARNAYPRGRRTQRPACRSLRLFAAAMALAAGGAALAQGGPGFPPARVEVATAELRDMAPVVEVPGTVVSQNDSRIASEVEGVLTWLSDVGDAVKAGDAIARIDPRLRQVELKRVRADVARLEADLRYRERQLERTEELAASNTASATLLDESRALRDQALQLLEDAKARRERAEYDLERTTIRAAFAGHVVERLASVGEYIGVGEDVVRLVDTHRKEIALAAPIALTRFVRPESSVTVRNGATVQQHPVRTVVPVGERHGRHRGRRTPRRARRAGRPGICLQGLGRRHSRAGPRAYSIDRRPLGRTRKRRRGGRPGHYPWRGAVVRWPGGRGLHRGGLALSVGSGRHRRGSGPGAMRAGVPIP